MQKEKLLLRVEWESVQEVHRGVSKVSRNAGAMKCCVELRRC